MPKPLTIVHNPLGFEHPYEQNPSERFPRFPSAGEEVVIGVGTGPTGRADKVSAIWKVDGLNKEEIAAGILQVDDPDLSYWKITLPAFNSGSQVTYQIIACSGDQKVFSRPYTFGVSGWVEIGDVIDYTLSPTAIEIQCSLIPGGDISKLNIEFNDVGRLGIRLEREKNSKSKSGSHDKKDMRPDSQHEGIQPVRVIEEDADRILLKSNDLKLYIYRHPCRLEIYHEDGTPILLESNQTKWLIGADGEIIDVKQAFISPADEAFFGFGERFNSLNQRGNVLDVRVYEQYKNHGLRTYLPISFFFSSEGYGILFNTSRYLSFDLASSDDKCWNVQAEVDSSGTLEYELIIDRDPKGILRALSALTSLPVLPPSWVFGPWMSSNEWNSQARIEKETARSRELGIPATALVIEAWSDEATFYIWNDAQYTPKSPEENFTLSDFSFPKSGKWPDPKAMIQDLHNNGLRVLLWQVPVLRTTEQPHPQNQLDREYMIENAYCVLDEKDEPYQVKPPWCKDGLVIDFTSADATEWWLGKRAYLLEEMDIDGFKTDGGEHLWGRKLRFTDGRTGAEIWNLYPNLYAAAYRQLLKDTNRSDGITFSRSGFTGAQQYPCHWAGDENSTWEAFRASILAGLNAGLSGIPFWGWDIAGFSGEIPTAELYLRATAMAAFCPIMQYHSEFNDHITPSNDRTPWNIEECTGDQDVVRIYRKYANLRMNLLPYIYSQAKESSVTGLPLMRALILEYRNNSEINQHPFQYLFGESLLIAPVVNENTTSQKVYLPEGDWYDFWTNKQLDGPLLIDYPTPKETIPVFVRAGTVLPLNLNDTYKIGEGVGNNTDQFDNLTFKIYPQKRGDLTLSWFDHVTEQPYEIRCSQIANKGIQVEVPSIPYDISFIFIQSNHSTLFLDDQAITILEYAEEFKTDAGASGFLDKERKLTYIRLPGKDSRRVIRIEV